MSGNARTPVYFCVLLMLLSLNAAWASSDRCAGAELSNANTSQLHFDGAACFSTHLPSAGLLMLEVNVPSAARVEPRLDFLGRSCGGSEAAPPAFRFQERLAHSAVILIRQAGDYHFCVEPQDPALELGEYRLANGFEADAFFKTDPDEYEPEPDPFIYDPGCSIGQFDGGDPASESADGFYKTDPDEYEPEPDPFIYDPCQSGGPWPTVTAVCRQTRQDDHGDTLRCATPVSLGQEVEAEIRNGPGDDSDFFTFSVGELTSVRIETSGDGDPAGALYDRHGFRLKTDDDGGRGTNFRIVKTLSPGQYFIRVAGAHGAEGVYRLLLQDLSARE